MRKLVTEADRKIAKMAELSTQLENPAPMLREIEKMEVQRSALLEELETAELRQRDKEVLKQVTAHQIRRMLQGVLEDFQHAGGVEVKEMLKLLVERVTLDPENRTNLTIRFAIGGFKMASPRGFDLIPRLRVTSKPLQI